MTVRPFHCLGRKMLICGGGALTSLLLGWTGSGSLLAQPADNPSAMQSAAAVQRNYLNKSVIQLPINPLDEAARGRLQEIQLWVKDHPGAAWTLKDKVATNQQGFNFQAPRDGEYWFTMVTVDRQGRSTPSDLRNEPPALVVIIDTLPPQIELTNLGNFPEGQLIQCDVQDVNMDNAQTRVFYQGGDRVYRPLESVRGRANVYCIPAQAVSTGMIRVTTQDLAKNQATRDVHINQMATRTVIAPPAPQHQVIIAQSAPDLKTPDEKTPPSFPPMPLPREVVAAPLPKEIQKTPEPPSYAVVQKTPEPSSNVVVQKMPDPSSNSFVQKMPSAVAQKMPEPSNNVAMPKTPSASGDAIRPNGVDGPRIPDQSAGSAPIAPPPTANVQRTEHEEPLKRQFVNSTKVFLDYQIENAGASGVGKVEVWITKDRAKSWQKLSEDSQRKSPVEVQFPGDGFFGVTLVASNGRGAGAAPPQAGDAPDWWIEVDTTKPAAQLTKVNVDFAKGQTFVYIHWSAQDKNLGDTPVELSYAATPQGRWLPIASGLKGEGQYRWSPPAEIGTQAYIRLSVRDVAGNTSVVHSQPVTFDDPARPRAVIRGISVGAPTSVTPPPIQIVQPPRSN